MLDFIIESITPMFTRGIYTVIIAIFLCIAMGTDIIHLKIPNRLIIAMLISRVVTEVIYISVYGFNGSFVLNCFLGFIVVGLFFLIPAMISGVSMGGDIKLAAATSLWTGLQAGLILSLAACILNLISRCIFKNTKATLYKNVTIGHKEIVIPISRKVVPLAPFFLIIFVLLLILFVCNNGNIAV